MIEFTMVGIPLLFILVSVFEISRGMWMYHTMAYAVKTGVRYAITHGINCVGNATNSSLSNPNNCTITAAQVAAWIQNNAVGVDPTKATLTFTSASSSFTCTLGTTCTSCANCTSVWPPYSSTITTSDDFVGQPIEIDIKAPFNSAVAFFSARFANFTLGATSKDYIQF